MGVIIAVDIRLVLYPTSFNGKIYREATFLGKTQHNAELYAEVSNSGTHNQICLIRN